MLVFFNFPKENTKTYRNQYSSVLNVINSLDISVTSNWLRIYETSSNDDSLLYEQAVSEILSADVAIFDMSANSTSIGFQLSYALQKGKPTLLLLDEKRNTELEKFVTGIQSSLLTIKVYSNKTLSHIVEDYLQNNAEEKKVRFNLVIDKKQDNYIEWAAFNYKKSKTEIIKEAIDQLMLADERYSDQ